MILKITNKDGTFPFRDDSSFYQTFLITLSQSHTGHDARILACAFLKNKKYTTYNQVFKFITDLYCVSTSVWEFDLIILSQTDVDDVKLVTIIKFYSDQKIRIRIALVDGESGIIKSLRNNFDIESLIRCNFHLKHETLNDIQKIYDKSKSPIRKGDRSLLNAAKGFIIISTFLPVYDMLSIYLDFMTKIRANKKSS